MSHGLSTIDRALLTIPSVTRGLRPESAPLYESLKGAGTQEALRKRMERLAKSGFLAASDLPRGSQLFRLSRKGVELTGAPAVFASAPTPAIMAEMLAVSALAWNADTVQFLTRAQTELLLSELTEEGKPLRQGSRFLIRAINTRDRDGKECVEPHLHYWLCELRPPEQLAKRIQIVLQNLTRDPFFRDLLTVGLLGVTLAVPTAGVKKTIETYSFPAEVVIEVVEALLDIAR